MVNTIIIRCGESYLREYLNNTFFNSCFSKQEQDKILKTRVYDDFISYFLFKIKNDFRYYFVGVKNSFLAVNKEISPSGEFAAVIFLLIPYIVAILFLVVYWLVMYPAIIFVHAIVITLWFFIENLFKDRIFCFSAKEVEKILKNNDVKMCKHIMHNDSNYKWWLRYPIKEKSTIIDYNHRNNKYFLSLDKELINFHSYASIINEDGTITHNVHMNDSNIGVRPVMWISV